MESRSRRRHRRTTIIQSGVIPYRRKNHRIEVLLVTSNTRKRWIIPKGHIEPHLSACESACKEAYEEAGVKGHAEPVPFGVYLHDGAPGSGLVEVYLMEVADELQRYPEDDDRERRWMPLHEARVHVLEKGLKRLFDEMAELLY